MLVEAIQSLVAAPEERAAPLSPAVSPVTSFEDLLAGAIHQASVLDKVASSKAEALTSGTLDDLHGTMIAAKEAEISVHLVGTLRNKLLDAFNELWRTSI